MAITKFRQYGTKAVPALLEKVNTLDIVNNLVDGGTGVPLSAEQGKILAGQISSTSTSVQQAILDLINGADAGYDTLSEIEAIIKANKAASDAADAQEVTDRTAGDNAVRSEFAAADTTLQTAITQEVADRQTAVSGEATLRQTADDAASARLDTIEGDDTVVGSIKNAVKSEADLRTAADTAESTARTAADDALTSLINNEVTDRTAADGVLQSAIDAEVQRATGAEQLVSDNLAAETTARVSGDNALDTRLKTVESGLVAGIRWMAQFPTTADLDNLDPAATEAGWGYFISGDKDVYVAIGSENGDLVPTSWVGSGKSFIKFADFAEVSGLVDNEKSRATLAEAALQNSIDAETAARVQADSDGAAALQTEVQRATAAETSNSNALTQEVTDRQAADAQEATDRQAADAALQSALDSEVTRSTGIDTDHESRLTTLEGPATVNGSVAKAVSDEAALRVAADTQEAADRVAGDAGVQANLDSVQASLQQADADEQVARVAGDKASSDRLDVIEGTGVGSIAKAEADAAQTAYDYILRPKVEGMGGTLKVVGDTVTVSNNIADGINGIVWGEIVVYAGTNNSEALAVNVSSVANNVITLATSTAGEFDGKTCKASYFYRAISNTGAGTGLAGEGLTA